jgi:F0F1-type ATP synthase assembly protein I
MARYPVVDEYDRTVSRLMTMSQVGTEMVAPIGLGFLLDYYVFHTLPLFMIIGAVLGLVGGIVHLVILNQPKRS